MISTNTIRAYLFPHRSQIAVWVCFTIAMQHANRPIMFSTLVLVLVPLVVTVRCEEKWYRVEEEDGSVTLALVLDRAVPFPVTVIVNTLDLQDSSVGDPAIGELLEEYLKTFFTIICTCLRRTGIIRMTAFNGIFVIVYREEL